MKVLILFGARRSYVLLLFLTVRGSMAVAPSAVVDWHALLSDAKVGDTLEVTLATGEVHRGLLLTRLAAGTFLARLNDLQSTVVHVPPSVHQPSSCLGP